MKKLLVVLMLLVMVFGLVGCSSDNREDISNNALEDTNNVIKEQVNQTTIENDKINNDSVEKVKYLGDYLSSLKDDGKKDFTIQYLDREITSKSNLNDFIHPDDYFYHGDDLRFMKDEPDFVSSDKEFNYQSMYNMISTSVFIREPFSSTANFKFYVDDFKGSTNLSSLIKEGKWGIDLGDGEKYFGHILTSDDSASTKGLNIINIIENILGTPDKIYKADSTKDLISSNWAPNTISTTYFLIYEYDEYMMFFTISEIVENEELACCELYDAYICSQEFYDIYIEDYKEHIDEIYEIGLE